jgi:hypothetical protein
MAPWDEAYALPVVQGDGESRLAQQVGDAGLGEVDARILRAASTRSQKVLRVVTEAVKAGGFSLHDKAAFDLHVRRVTGLVAAGQLIGLGNLRRPAFSEVRLPG